MKCPMPMLNHKNAISVFFEFAAGIHGRAARRFLYRLVKQPCNQSRRLGSIECRSSSQSVRSPPRIPAERPSLHSCRDLQKPGSRPLQRMAVSLSFALNDAALIKKAGAPLGRLHSKADDNKCKILMLYSDKCSIGIFNLIQKGGGCL